MSVADKMPRKTPFSFQVFFRYFVAPIGWVGGLICVLLMAYNLYFFVRVDMAIDDFGDNRIHCCASMDDATNETVVSPVFSDEYFCEFTLHCDDSASVHYTRSCWSDVEECTGSQAIQAQQRMCDRENSPMLACQSTLRDHYPCTFYVDYTVVQGSANPPLLDAVNGSSLAVFRLGLEHLEENWVVLLVVGVVLGGGGCILFWGLPSFVRCCCPHLAPPKPTSADLMESLIEKGSSSVNADAGMSPDVQASYRRTSFRAGGGGPVVSPDIAGGGAGGTMDTTPDSAPQQVTLYDSLSRASVLAGLAVPALVAPPPPDVPQELRPITAPAEGEVEEEFYEEAEAVEGSGEAQLAEGEEVVEEVDVEVGPDGQVQGVIPVEEAAAVGEGTGVATQSKEVPLDAAWQVGAPVPAPAPTAAPEPAPAPAPAPASTPPLETKV